MLLRIANVNPANVVAYTDRVLYSGIGVFIILYFAYATIGGATFVDASSNYSHPWWRWLVGPLIALAVIAYDRAVVGRVAINYEDLESDDPERLLKKRSFGMYIGRALLALLVAVIITEPLMLDRYRGEIDAYLNTQQNREALTAGSTGAIVGYEEEKKKLDGEEAADDAAVQKLRDLADGKRAEAQKIYAQALDDSKGDGVTRKAGCPPGGYCDTLVQRSRRLQTEATELDTQATNLRASQQAGRDARTERRNQLDTLIRDARQNNLQAIEGNAGFGARTKAMWHLITTDFAGIGFFYLGTALLLIALDCAAIALKLLSHGNAYERAEAREGRQHELKQTRRHSHELKATKAAADAYGEAATIIVTDGIQAAADTERLREAARKRAGRELHRTVNSAMHPDADDERTGGWRPFGMFRQRRPAQPAAQFSSWPAPENTREDEDYPGDGDNRRTWSWG